MGPTNTTAIEKVDSVPCPLLVFAYILAIALLCGCSKHSATSTHTQRIALKDEVYSTEFDTRKEIGSAIVIKNQYRDIVRHIISAELISIAPRSFAAFNINSINELSVEDAHIEIFSSNGDDSDSMNGGEDDIDFTETLREFAESLPEDYGVISRLHMNKVRITLHGSGKRGAPIHVHADSLLKEFRDDSEPELLNVRFYDGDSKHGLRVARAQWNTKEGQFLVKTSIPE